MSGRAPILNLCKVEKNFDLLSNFWYIKDSNILSGAQRKIFEKGTIFFGHPVYTRLPILHHIPEDSNVQFINSLSIFM